MKNIITYFLVLWVLINVGLFIGSGNFLLKNDNNVFFPFGKQIEYVYTSKDAIDVKDYDYTEFWVCALLIPAIVFTVTERKILANLFNGMSEQFKNRTSSESENNFSELNDQKLKGSNKMHKQRIAILIVAGIGALGTFLPWVHAPIVGSVPGSSGSDGWITFILFVITIGLCFVGNRTKTLKLGFLVGAIVPSLLASIIAIIKIIDFNSKMSSADVDNPFAKAITQTVGIGIGLYLIVLAGIAVLVLGIILKKSDIQLEPNVEN
ncbi:MAG: hypothetical protein LC122_01555 [Chitinophagales bacterium]|nr:hypothetical protein [Chitinophagales bacterium]